MPDRIAPFRRWFAGAALTGALALSAEIGSVGFAGAGPAALCTSVDVSSALLPGPCSIGDLGTGAGQATRPNVERIRDRTGLEFVADTSTRTSVFVDARVTLSTQHALIAAVDRDVAEVEQEYGRRFSTVPTIYAFATRSSFALGLEQLFGARAPDAGVLAAASGGVALPRQGAIVVNLQNTDPDRVTIIRHELTHILVHQIAGTSTILPAWFDEGLATLEQESLTETDGGARARAIAVSLLKAGKISLADLRAPELWQQRNAALDGQAYVIAAEAVRPLQQQVSPAGIVRMLEAAGRGVPFADAFAQETGYSIAAYENSLPERLSAAASRPQISVAPSEGGITWTLSGFAPESAIDIRISGPSYLVEYWATTDRYGVYRAAFGSTAPSGDYTIEANDRAGLAKQVVRLGAG